MTYRRVLLVRWSRRDRLTVVLVAAITAVLVGVALVLAATGATVTGMAGATGTDDGGYVTVADDVDEAAQRAPADASIVPLAEATRQGERATVVGIPPDGIEAGPVELRPPSDGNVVRGPHAGGDVTLDGIERSLTVDVSATPDGELFPQWWYVAPDETVDQLGETGALVVTNDGGALDGGAVDGRTVPLVGTLEFFVRGTGQLLDGVGVIAAGVGVLVAVVVGSVTRMTVRDRLATVAVLRATGLPARRVLALFAGRAGLLTGTGVLAGTALGIVLTNAAVNLAVFAGVPTTLGVRVTPRVVGVLGPALVGLLAVGTAAGLVASIPVARRDPAALHRKAAGATTSDATVAAGGNHAAAHAHAGSSSLRRLHRWSVLVPARVRSHLRPRLLDGGSIVPTAATLTVFVAVVVMATTVAATLAPLATDGGGAVIQSGAAHPWSSSVDADYGDVLRSEGVTASPEIVAFGVVDDEPFLVRGAAFDGFASVSGASITAGGPPDAPDEAVVGRDLAGALDVGVGDVVPLGGSNRPAVSDVEITGVYRAPGYGDDQLIVPLATARHLSNVGPDEVNMIRLGDGWGGRDTTPSGTSTGSTPAPGDGTRVTDLAVPATVPGDSPVPANVTVANVGTERTDRTVTVSIGESERSRTVSLDAGERRTVQVSLDPPEPGTYRVTAGDLRTDVTVHDDRTLRFGPLPREAPPGSTVLVTVVDDADDPVSNATVSTEHRDGGAAVDGPTPVELPGSGTATLVASAPGFRNATATIPVAEDAARDPVATLSVSPARPHVAQRPEAGLRLRNPWNTTGEWTVALDGPASTDTREVSLGPGEVSVLTWTLDRTGTGTYAVDATVDGRLLDRANYTVTGDERLVSALATGERHDVVDSGIGQATTHALGNLRVLLGTLVGLTAVATVAATTAAFARTVHARRYTIAIHRATGATPRQLLTTVLADAFRVAVPATVLAILGGYVALWLLGAVGLFRAFGVALVPSPSIGTIALVATGSLFLALASAAVATLGMLRATPARLFRRGSHQFGTERPDGRSGISDAGTSSDGDRSGVSPGAPSDPDDGVETSDPDDRGGTSS